MRSLSPPFIRFFSLTFALLLCLTGCHNPSLPDPPVSESVESESPTFPAITLPPIDVSDSPLPVLSIVTDEQAPILSRVNYLNAQLTVTEPQSRDTETSYTCRIRGRGHSSFNSTSDTNDYLSKNSYRIKLDQKADLLPAHNGGNNRDWILLSCKYDASALRNHLIWDLARRMGSIPYVSAYTWVELYVNGDYRGLYMLTEQIEVASDRVDIDESASSDPARVGYLLEYDFRGDIETGACEGLTYFYLPDCEVEWVLKSEVYTTAETAAIRTHLLSCHEAILSGDRARIAELIDVPSFVDMFILQELSKNPDVGSTSFYLQRDAGGKLYLTAPWDFDFSFGTYSTSVSNTGLVTQSDKVPPHPWFAALLRQAWFVEAVQTRMEELSPLLEQTLDTLDSLSSLLAPVSDRNDERWGVYGEKYAKYVNDQVSVKLNSYEEHVEFLRSWTNRRWSAMERALRRARRFAA